MAMAMLATSYDRVMNMSVAAVNPRLQQFPHRRALAVVIGVPTCAGVILLTFMMMQTCTEICGLIPMSEIETGHTCKDKVVEEKFSTPWAQVLDNKLDSLSGVFGSRAKELKFDCPLSELGLPRYLAIPKWAARHEKARDAFAQYGPYSFREGFVDLERLDELHDDNFFDYDGLEELSDFITKSPHINPCDRVQALKSDSQGTWTGSEGEFRACIQRVWELNATVGDIPYSLRIEAHDRIEPEVYEEFWAAIHDEGDYDSTLEDFRAATHDEGDYDSRSDFEAIVDLMVMKDPRGYGGEGGEGHGSSLYDLAYKGLLVSWGLEWSKRRAMGENPPPPAPFLIRAKCCRHLPKEPQSAEHACINVVNQNDAALLGGVLLPFGTTYGAKWASVNQSFFERNILYCCIQDCPRVASALGSAFGYAAYLELLITLPVLLIYVSWRAKQVSISAVMTAAQVAREEKDKKTTAEDAKTDHTTAEERVEQGLDTADQGEGILDTAGEVVGL